MKKTIVSALLMTGCALASAKLPPLDDAAKAKGAETAARASWQTKADAHRLCQVQDRVAAHYRKSADTGKGKEGATVPAAMATATAFTVSPGGSPAAAAATPAAAAAPTAATALPAAGPATAPGGVASKAPASPVAVNPAVAGGTAAVAAGPATPTPCADPGPFSYNPVQQTPLETSGAHSPAGNAVSPPSVNAPAASMAPAKKP